MLSRSSAIVFTAVTFFKGESSWPKVNNAATRKQRNPRKKNSLPSQRVRCRYRSRKNRNYTTENTGDIYDLAPALTSDLTNDLARVLSCLVGWLCKALAGSKSESPCGTEKVKNTHRQGAKKPNNDQGFLGALGVLAVAWFCFLRVPCVLRDELKTILQK